MIFVNKGYNKYKYVVEVKDNYIVLTNQRTVTADWQNPEQINVIYQYFYPSTQTIENTRNYTSNNTFTEIETTNDFYYRADAPTIMTIGMIMTFFFIFILNAMTRIGKKGGIFFGQ